MSQLDVQAGKAANAPSEKLVDVTGIEPVTPLLAKEVLNLREIRGFEMIAVEGVAVWREIFVDS